MNASSWESGFCLQHVICAPWSSPPTLDSRWFLGLLFAWSTISERQPRALGTGGQRQLNAVSPGARCSARAMCCLWTPRVAIGPISDCDYHRYAFVYVYVYPPNLGWRVEHLGGLTFLPALEIVGSKGGTLSHLSYWNLLHKILDVAA